MLTEIQKNIIKVLQEDIPDTREPFKDISAEIGMTEEALLNEIKFLLEEGYIKRMGAVLAHRKIGLHFNPMIVMTVDSKDIDEVGEKIGSLPEVTHCYHRPRIEGFPYDLFAMIHCNTKEEASELVKRITSDDRIKSYELLYSLKEYKKTSMKYFI